MSCNGAYTRIFVSPAPVYESLDFALPRKWQIYIWRGAVIWRGLFWPLCKCRHISTHSHLSLCLLHVSLRSPVYISSLSSFSVLQFPRRMFPSTGLLHFHLQSTKKSFLFPSPPLLTFAYHLPTHPHPRGTGFSSQTIKHPLLSVNILMGLLPTRIYTAVSAWFQAFGRWGLFGVANKAVLHAYSSH